MDTIKAFTDINQSKKLIGILSPESADMFYDGIRDINTNKYHIPHDSDPTVGKGYEGECPTDCIGTLFLPCWSLTALLDVFPCSKESPIVNLTRGGWNPSFTRRWFATWEDEDKNVFYSGDGITPVDAVVELILKLHEQKLL